MASTSYTITGITARHIEFAAILVITVIIIYLLMICTILQYLQINTWAFPYCHPETPILARDVVEGQYVSRNDNQANMEMPMY